MKNEAAVALGSIKTKKKAKSSRKNGKLGGRPRTSIQILDVQVGLHNFINYYNTEINTNPEEAINGKIISDYVFGFYKEDDAE